MNKFIVTITILFCLTLLLASCNFIPKSSKHPKGSPEWMTEQGVNTQHLLEFGECYATYNGKQFTLGDSIDHMVEVFGPYDRKVLRESYIYIWDSLGIVMTTYWGSGISPKVNGIHLYWNSELSEDDFDDGISERLGTKQIVMEQQPKNYFQGRVIMGGAPLGRGMHIDDFRSQSDMYFTTYNFQVFYEYRMRGCYDHVATGKVHGMYMLVYVIRISGDGKDIEHLSFTVKFLNA